ncbi:MAG TPA: hypothetical protein VM840_09725 [Actinomycetota bacterium]|nr:hypothetical protein [Actinomycetota bacterium]
MALERPAAGDREAYLEQDGLLVRRLNVPWESHLGALWELRMDDGQLVVFSESELRQLGRDGRPEESEIPGLQEAWGEAPRRTSYPFQRLGGGSGAATALLAFVVFAIAGVLLIWSGLAQTNMALAGAGAVLILVGMGAAAALVS